MLFLRINTLTCIDTKILRNKNMNVPLALAARRAGVAAAKVLDSL